VVATHPPGGTLIAAVTSLLTGSSARSALLDAYDSIDDSRPTVIFAYTVKGYGLLTEGHPQNHSSLVTASQMRDLADRLGADLDNPWAGFAGTSAAAAL
jgi:pyruvate dehydrogenase E1 component